MIKFREELIVEKIIGQERYGIMLGNGKKFKGRGKMRKIRYRVPAAIFPIFIKNGQVLLQKRQNTGYIDGKCDFAASGHVEENESMITALVREVKEELGIDLIKENIEFGTFIHKRYQSSVYYNAYFLAHGDNCDFRIDEPEKCSELKWFDINDLPKEFIEDRRVALENIMFKISYSEMGCDDLS